jgi:photosystem II stability/assembly factor-like uncharacterized protein
VHRFALTPACPGRIWLQHHGGVYRSDDGGDSWHEVGSGLPSDFGFPILAHPRAADTAYVVPLTSDLARWFADGRTALYRTDDAGRTWRPLTAGLPAPSYGSVLRQALAADGLAPLGLYFGTTAGALYASVDEGESWRELARDLPRILSVHAAVVAG